MQLSPNDLTPVDENNMGAAGMLLPVKNIQQTSHLDLQPSLFAALTHRGQGRVLTGIYEPNRQGPTALLRGISPLYQQHLPILLDNHTRGHLGVWEEDPLTLRADRPDPAHALFGP